MRLTQKAKDGRSWGPPTADGWRLALNGRLYSTPIVQSVVKTFSSLLNGLIGGESPMCPEYN